MIKSTIDRIFIMKLEIIMVLALVVILPNNASAQTSDCKTLPEPAKQTFEPDSNNPKIDVGNDPKGLGVDHFLGRAYVANSRHDSISVISTESSAKIEEDIPVGFNPTFIAVDVPRHTVYVANEGDDTISVISALERSKVDITVGNNPKSIGITEEIIYVANSGDSDYISNL